jgi:RNA polymerase sigma factor (sigma-70 family)
VFLVTELSSRAHVDGIDELDRRGRQLLAELAADPASDCWRQFDALFYELVWKYLRSCHRVLGARVARYLGVEGDVAPPLQPGEVEEVAHDATKVALRRVRQNAARFDHERGTPTKWVIGAAEYAYVEVAKTIAAARRPDRTRFVPPEELFDIPDSNPTTEEHVLRHLQDEEALADAAEHLSEKEFAAVRLTITAGYSYAEVAELMFGDAAMTKQVDGLLTRGKRKLAAAWESRRPVPPSAVRFNVSESAEDMEGSNE